MNLTEIIAEIDEKYPNSTTSDSKVRKMNTLQKRLFRKMRKQTFASYSLTNGVSSYPITQNIDDIFDVLVGNSTANVYCSYPKRKLTDTAWGSTSSYYGKWYTFFSDPTAGDYLDIHPTPTTNENTMVLYYYEEPPQLNSGDLNSTPTLDVDYHMLFVYYVCKEIAESYRDFEIANGFSIQYNELYSEMQSTFQEPEVKLVHSESGW